MNNLTKSSSRFPARLRQRFMPLAACAVLLGCGTSLTSCSDSDYGAQAGNSLYVEPLDAAFPLTLVDTNDPPGIIFTITNRGLVNATDLALAISPSDGDFTLEGDQCAGVLATGAKCTTQVVFRPKSAGYKTGQLTVSSKESGTQTYGLRGQAEAGAGLSLMPTFQDFGRVTLNADSQVYSFTVTNGTQQRTGNLQTVLAGTNAGDFALTSNACGSTLGAGESCAVSLVMRPQSEGAKSATLTVTDTLSTVSLVASLTGTGRNANGLSILPGEHAFGSVAVGGQQTQVFTVENSGLEATSALLVETIGDTSNSFAILPASTCSERLLAPSQTCDVVVAFSPTSTGDKLATLRVAADVGGQVSAALSGRGTPVGDLLEFAPLVRDFSKVAVGARSSYLFTLRNRGDVVTGVPAFNLVDSGNQFSMTPSDACKAPLEPGSSCLVTVEFAPTTSGKKDASLIATASPGGQTSSDLTGEGVDPLSISPTDKDFGDVKINSEGPTDLITVRNSGAVPTGPLQINLNGGGSKEFEIVSNTCEEQGKGIALKANAECFITVGFTPTKIGAKVATLTVSGSPGGNVSTSIRGNAVAAGLVISPLEHDFGNAVVDDNSNNGPTFSFTVRNDSQAQTARLTTMINPESPDDFTITNDGCEGRQLPVNGSCNITVRFDPTGVDARSASLEVSAGANSTTLVALRGNGTYNDALLIEPTRYDFGTVSANQFIDQTFDIVNRGQSQLRDLNVELLTGSASFNVISDGCSDVLAAGSRCSVTVRFGSPTPGQTVRTRTLEATCSNAGVPDVTSELRGFVQQ